MNTNDGSNQNITLRMWFRSLRWPKRIAVVMVALILTVGAVAFAASVLSDHANSKTKLSKDRYVKISMTGAYAEGSIRPGLSVDLSPVLKNQGNINSTALAKITVPVLSGSPMYDFEVNSSWSLIESDVASGVYVYGFGGDELAELAPGESTDALVEHGFTMKSSITGAEFTNMSEINIEVDGYLVDAGAGVDPGTVWGMLE